MMHKLVTAISMATIAFASAAPAIADQGIPGNPSGTGQPSQTCQTVFKGGGGAPGNASGAPGSVFNEPGVSSPNGGTGGTAYNNARQGAGAPSQYDVACYQTTNHGTAKPPATMTPTASTASPSSSTAPTTAAPAPPHK